MSLPELHISRPGVAFPDTRVDNAEILRRVREQFRGTDEAWRTVESGIEHFFGLWGALLAVPVLSMAQSVFNHFRFETMPDAPPDSLLPPPRAG